MSSAPPTYDLVIMLDPQAEDAARAKVLADTRSAIESQGELVRHDEWGNRTLTYPIAHRTMAEYHLMQFHASTAGLLSQLDRSLRIADEALRFRIVKLRSGVREAPDMRASAEPVQSQPPASAPTQEPAQAAQPAPAEPAAEPAVSETGESQPPAGPDAETGESQPPAGPDAESGEGQQPAAEAADAPATDASSE